MPPAAPAKSYLLGGIVLCAFPATVLVAMHVNGARLPMPWPILFGVFFVYGLRSVATSLFRLGLESGVSWVFDAVAAAGFAVFAFWIAWQEKGGWGGGIPLVPDSWNQYIPRILFAGGGVIGVLGAGRCLRKAINQWRGKRDDGIRHV